MSAYQPFYTTRACPVCSATECHLIHTISYPSEKERILPTEYRIVFCLRCGMAFDDFDSDVTCFARYYATEQKYALPNSGGAGGTSQADLSRYSNIWRQLVRMKRTDKAQSVLDLGCGKGGMLHFLYQRGFRDLTGVDASPCCVDSMKQEGLFTAICADCVNFTSERSFDIIIFNQVLEHIFYPLDVLSHIRTLLKEDGLLFCSVPDAGRYFKGSQVPFYYFDQEHINHFTADSLRSALNGSGFAVRRVEHNDVTPVDNFFNPILDICARPSLSLLSKNQSGRRKLTVADALPVVRYVENSRNREDFSQIQKIKADCVGKGYLWGVGAYCLRLLQAGIVDSLHIAGLIDVDPAKAGTEVRNLRIYTPDILESNNQSENFVIITSVLYEREIRQSMEAMGFKGKVYTLDVRGSTDRKCS